MANFGSLIDGSYDPQKQDVYNMFTDYFRNPRMIKIKDVEQYSMYLTKIHTLLGIEFRYLIAFVYKDSVQVGGVETLDNLSWVSFQTRTLSEEYNTPSHTYIPQRTPSLDKRIKLVRKTEKSYAYIVEELPILITMIPKGKNEYSATGSVIPALETFNTIVSFKDT